MGINTVDTGTFKDAFLARVKGLEAKEDWINEPNVLPMSDGDTGTNMTLTIMAVAREVAELENPTMDQLVKTILPGSLRGARRNSGVMLSQLLRGLTKKVKTVGEIDTTILASAMVGGTETVHKAVMKPKEGTILTVIKTMADKGLEMASQTDNMEESIKEITEYDDHVLGQTSEMPPVLEQAGVMDSGRQGLIQVVEGAADGFLGKIVDFSPDMVQDSRGMPAAGIGVVKGAARTDIDTSDTKLEYCAELIINLEEDYADKDKAKLKSYLGFIGDSLVVISDDEIVKVHMYTSRPDPAFEKALTYGFLSRMKIDNVREEYQEEVIQDSERLIEEQAAGEQAGEDQESGDEAPSECRGYDFIAVSSGEGLSDIPRGIRADHLIEGGQTVDPSAEGIPKAIDRVNAENIFILPNNKNIIMATQQARDLTEDKSIIVIPSRTAPQEITTLVNFISDLEPEENTQTMIGEIGNVRTAQVTCAVRTTSIDGIDTEERDIMALEDHGMLAVGESMDVVALDAMKEMLDEECKLVTTYYGADVSEHEADTLRDQAQEQYPDREIELQYGGQSIYYYLISAEQKEDVPGASRGANTSSPPAPASETGRCGKRRRYHTCT